MVDVGYVFTGREASPDQKIIFRFLALRNIFSTKVLQDLSYILKHFFMLRYKLHLSVASLIYALNRGYLVMSRPELFRCRFLHASAPAALA